MVVFEAMSRNGEIVKIDISLNSSIEELGPLEEVVRKFAESKGADEDAVHKFVYCVRECVINSMKYVNNFEPGKNVGVRLYRVGRKLIAYVEDTGTGQVDERYFDESFVTGQNLLETHGRGLFLVSKHSDEMPFFTYTKGGKKIRIVKNLTNSS